MRQVPPELRVDADSFNPRICKRCDGLEVQLTKAQAVSIHASVKDATTTASIRGGTKWFQSTHL